MTRKSMQELLTQVASTLPDNSTGTITPAVMRAMFTDFIQAIAPAYTSLQMPTANTRLMNIAPVKFGTYQTATNSDITQMVGSAVTGEVTRSERGTSTINFSADFETSNGRFMMFELYKNNVPTGWRITGNGGGAGNPVAVALTAIDYADPAAVYSIWVSCEQNSTSVTFSQVGLIIGIDPVNSYV